MNRPWPNGHWARAYNTDIANGLFVIFALISLAAAYWHNTLGGYHVVVDILLFGVLSGVALSMTHQTTKFAYRMTASGLEFCEWKEFPEWLPRLLKWAAGITCVFMLMLATIHPAALIGAIAGPGMMGLMYLKMGTSSQFREMHERYRHKVQPWSDFTKMTVFRRRAIIGLDFTYFNPMADEGKGRMIDTDRLLYCRKAQLDDLIAIIREHLPESTPYEEAYIPIYA